MKVPANRIWSLFQLHHNPHCSPSIPLLHLVTGVLVLGVWFFFHFCTMYLLYFCCLILCFLFKTLCCILFEFARRMAACSWAFFDELLGRVPWFSIIFLKTSNANLLVFSVFYACLHKMPKLFISVDVTAFVRCLKCQKNVPGCKKRIPFHVVFARCIAAM